MSGIIDFSFNDELFNLSSGATKNHIVNDYITNVYEYKKQSQKLLLDAVAN